MLLNLEFLLGEIVIIKCTLVSKKTSGYNKNEHNFVRNCFVFTCLNECRISKIFITCTDINISLETSVFFASFNFP